ncbi:MAG: potassium transporter, partial [Gammaproteobacteria bacterium]
MSTTKQVETCDLCVIGAGVAGLNALAVARDYLPKSARVILVDRRAHEGGMWLDTYDYVRLHQPHRMFTAGNIPWRKHRAPEYLADKIEVLAHLSDCLSDCRNSYQLDTYFGNEFVSLREEESEQQWSAILHLRDIVNGEERLIKAARCVKAFGFRVPTNPALPFESNHVNSITPHGDSLVSDEYAASDAPS